MWSFYFYRSHYNWLYCMSGEESGEDEPESDTEIVGFNQEPELDDFNIQMTISTSWSQYSCTLLSL